MKGYFCLVLHTHLPYVHHPEYEEFLEERWFFEAINETYIPLLMVFDRLAEKKIPFKITVSLTPPLLEMMSEKNLSEKFVKHTKKLIELCEKELNYVKSSEEKQLAMFYKKRFEDNLQYYESLSENLIEGFKKHATAGNLELITCNATHAYLPLLQHDKRSVEIQVKVGVEAFKQRVGYNPRGIWLAECGYYPGLDEILSKYGLKFFFVDSHAFWYADEKPKFGVYRPIMTSFGIFALARDPESSEQVWSATLGYPGDGRYREFYRDIGYDREYEYIKPYIDPSGVRVNTGIKYHKITSRETPLDKKEFYNRFEALKAAEEHAEDFLKKKIHQVERLFNIFGEPPLIVAPFDTELFGHWWFEGPEFIEAFFTKMAETRVLKPLTALEAIEKYDSYQILTPAESSWGNGGYHETWLNGKNDWIQLHIKELSERLYKHIDNFRNETDPLKFRLLNQMLREVLLLQSSDWPFLITTGTAEEYAVNRIKTHVKRFLDLEKQLLEDNIDEAYLTKVESIDSIFPWLDFRIHS
ncbi:glycoside hydrolase family 57 protein [Pseudothermotoga thermarum]|uniref:(1->4)-alpha-D-glucan branching enzyme n=1 Tax=Pseudothermotoga thermarum DSM 5069 TaxID=688269 RepID=F7YW93_9THEM|nr:1,4-alpha-glucan branching protein domain-containing protein [Pseudothermotoga thermarum]AEH51865.1 (1->4)-alpha-D-glucan branching enzyme [Pseudothermotoga thermarum DSM 5069]